ncbi:unnamed protein product [Ostreobium quekettii]|uniref:Uncharacterized protein n=1 Tax=Ostreobium quekettii TaxID=121088 RepID=A0A8S1J8R2_9CHLO|nr:unnamed protein product [Ostreobium quekettii]
MGSGGRLVEELAGHTTSVLCVQAHHDAARHLVASGGEDGALCLFDLRLGREPTSRCVGFPGNDVVSVAFHTKPHALFVASDCSVAELDMRKTMDSLEQCTTHRHMFNDDDINQVSVHPGGHLLASCDDSGEVAIIDIDKNTLHRRLSGLHTTICSSAAFLPGGRPPQLITGGLDAMAACWGASEGAVRWAARMGGEQEGGGGQVFNPPMVYSLAVSNFQDDGRPCMLAIGRGDGAVCVGDPCESGEGDGGGSCEEGDRDGQHGDENGDRLAYSAAADQGKNCDAGEQAGSDDGDADGSVTADFQYMVLDREAGGHTSSASSVAFLPECDGRFAVSGGNDRRLIMWDWTEVFQEGGRPMVWTVDHGRKVNWVATGPEAGEAGRVFVADVGSRISVYRLE